MKKIHGKTLITVGSKVVDVFNGMVIGQADRFLPPKQINNSRFFAYTAEDKTHRVARLGSVYKIRPATPEMFAVIPVKKSRKKAA
jgi:hypothetical protein